ncbi:MAG TPA: 6-bladed beta-propeller, partial [Vicinamibacterales bacterium]|nr:6-bladed beta-propeller [Vicinamibacterales bacterium]
AAAAGRGAAAAGGAAPAAGGGRGAGGPVGAAAGATIGHQVLKFSPDGKLLLALGKKGGAREPDYFYQPNDVVTASNGDIFVAEGHGGGGRVLKFDRTGKFLLQFGTAGAGPGQFNTPHALALDSRGRLFVGDRANNRIQIFDQSGKFLEEWRQFGRPSGIFIDANDVLYSADSESAATRNDATWKRGIRIGSARDGKVTAFIPDPWTATPVPATTSPEGVAADKDGNVYGAQVTETGMKKYQKQ